MITRTTKPQPIDTLINQTIMVGSRLYSHYPVEKVTVRGDSQTVGVFFLTRAVKVPVICWAPGCWKAI